jgi:hypothetical protein
MTRSRIFSNQVVEYLFNDLFATSEHADSLLIWLFRRDTVPILGREGSRLGRHFLVQLKASDGVISPSR